MILLTKFIRKVKKYTKSRKDALLFYKVRKLYDNEYSVNDKCQFIRITDFEKLEMFSEEKGDALSNLVNNDCKNRFRNGSTLIIAMKGKEWVAYGWLAGKSDFWIAEIDYIIDMSGSKVGMLYDFQTREEYRGLGIYPLLIRYMVQTQPDLECLIYCYETNISSRRGIEKAGGELECKLQHKSKNIADCFSLHHIRVLGSKYRYFGLKYAKQEGRQ